MPPSRILVVEDDFGTREALRKILEFEGCEVEVAGDGEKAVGCLARRSYDAIVLDIVLPKLSGTDVMEYIAGTRPEALASIVVVTGLEVSEIRKLFPTVCETLSKPIMPSKLLAAVRRCTRREEESGGTEANGTSG